MLEVTLEQLCSFIVWWNAINSPNVSTGGCSVATICAGGSVLRNAEWKLIENGSLKGSRYIKTSHGFVVQSPGAVGEISLVPENTAVLLGITL